MPKGIMRATGKSGLLPKPKAIFKQPYKHEVYQKPVDTGYAEDILHPKNITRDYIIPKVSTPEELLLKSAKEPAKKYSPEEISKLPVAQQFKIKNAEMRRQYLKESYEKEVKRLERVDYYAEQARLEEAKIAEEKAKHTQSQAELYTAPTIESYLEGPLVRPRTEEEKEALKLKREANRLQTKLNIDTERASKLFELYNAASKYAITEDKLQQMVDSAFISNADDEWSRIARSVPAMMSTTKNAEAFDNAIFKIASDNVNGGPGFEQVSDFLSGYSDDIQELAAQIQKERNEQLIQSADQFVEETENKMLNQKEGNTSEESTN
jgi:hypothetical protein